MLEQIKEAIKGENGSELVQGLASLVFAKPEEGKSNPFLQTEVAKDHVTKAQVAYFEDNQGSVRKEVHDRYDQDFKKHGIELKGKSHETLHSVLEDYSKLKSQYQDVIPKSEYNELKKELEKTQSGDSFYKSEFEKTQELLKQERESWTSKYNDLEKSIKSRETSEWLKQGLVGLEFSVPEDVVNTLIQAKINEYGNRVISKDGETYIVGPDGKAERDADHGFLSSKAFWKRELQSVLKQEQPTRQPANKDTIEKHDGESTLSLDRTKFSTRMEFNTHVHEVLLRLGIPRNGSEWQKLKMEAYNRYGVKELPRN